MTDIRLGIKAYGNIAHLPGSKLLSGTDKFLHKGQVDICTKKTRDKNDLVIVQEKLDGSCVAVARIGDSVAPFTRRGYHAMSSPYEQHRLFATWLHTEERINMFLDILKDGERICGEWMAQAHGTRYELHHDPFVAFDIMKEHDRVCYADFISRVAGIPTTMILHVGGSISIVEAMNALGQGDHGAIDPPEGVVYRVERNGKVDFLAKYVRPDYQAGKYLPEINNCDPYWNWRS